MKTPSLLLAGSLALVIAACSAGGASPADRTPEPTPTPVPTEPVGRDPGGNQGGGSAPGQPGDGVVNPNPVPGPPDLEEPTLVEPVPGAVRIRDASASALEAAVNGRNVAVRVAWWGGVEPCDVLAGVNVVREESTITLTVKSGSAPGSDDVACIQIAMLKATIVDLGELDPGTYTIQAFGEAAPIEVVVS